MSIPAWLKSAVFYEIYPQSFQDSNGDGIGDLAGIVRRLDHVQALGCNAIWLNPCFESPFQDAGYDVSDFYRIAPRYGTNADMRTLCREVHARGMHLILDLVAGHTSIEHPWFQQSCQVTPNRYSNYYLWTDDWGGGCEGYRFINGYAPRPANFMINFFYCQPALNYGFNPPDPRYPWQLPCDHPDVRAVREELRNIMRFWLEIGCDGFRVDMASSLVRGADAWGGLVELWNDYRDWMARSYPEAILVSEWSQPIKALTAGFHVDFKVHFGRPGYNRLLRNEAYRVPNSEFQGGVSFFDRAAGGDAAEFLGELVEEIAATVGRGYVAVPTGNHDIGRVSQGRDTAELKALYTFLLLLPGVPFLYYGDEIGMRYVYGLTSKEGGYNRTGARTPMQWDEAQRNAGFSDADPEQLYLPLDAAADRPTVAGQEAAPDSLLHFVRRVLALRAAHPALAADGDFIVRHVEAHRAPVVYERCEPASGERFLVAVNPTAEAVCADFGCPGIRELQEVFSSGADLRLEPGALHLELGPAGYAVYRI